MQYPRDVAGFHPEALLRGEGADVVAGVVGQVEQLFFGVAHRRADRQLRLMPLIVAGKDRVRPQRMRNPKVVHRLVMSKNMTSGRSRVM